jgi:hypothetical protein
MRFNFIMRSTVFFVLIILYSITAYVKFVCFLKVWQNLESRLLEL